MSTGDVLLIVVVVALVFVFKGTPDLFDKWHDMAMSAAVECKK